MRKYTFEFKDNGIDEYGKEDFKDHTKFVDYIYIDTDESDCEEFAREAKQFLLARGFSPFNADGLVYLNWKFPEPEYNGEYLVTLKDEEYATCAQYIDGQWFDIHGNEIKKEIVEAWADIPEGAHR